MIFKLKLILMTCLTIFVATTAHSANKKSIELQAIITSTGPGIHAGYHINDMLFIGIDYTTADLSQSKNSSDEQIKANLDFTTNLLMLRVSPFSGSFFLQGGFVSRAWDLKASGTGLIGNSGLTGTINADVDWSDTAGNFGFGWNWISDLGLSGGIGLGVISGEKPKVNYKVTGVASLIPQSEIEKDKKDFEDVLNRTINYPYIHLNLGWNF